VIGPVTVVPLIVVSSTATNGGTAQAVRTVVNDVVAGTLLYDAVVQASEDVMAKQQGRKALISERFFDA